MNKKLISHLLLGLVMTLALSACHPGTDASTTGSGGNGDTGNSGGSGDAGGSGNMSPGDPLAGDISQFNAVYRERMREQGKPLQESPWGFQEIDISGAARHDVGSLDEYLDLVNANTSDSHTRWADGRTHVIRFAEGTYDLPLPDSYFLLPVPSRTIILGAGPGRTIFRATLDPAASASPAVFRAEKVSDVVFKGFSFHNQTRDNKWKLFYIVNHDSSDVEENFLFEDIEFDDSFGAIGSDKAPFNFITLRGLRKRIGNTSERIRANYSIPVPVSYQFPGMNNEQVKLAGQVGIRTGNSTVIHDCMLGDNISATLDIYNNYVEIVGTELIDPLHDHSIKAPHANHLYIHDSRFRLTYSEKIINNGYYNPTFFTHQGFRPVNGRDGGYPNHHFKNLLFERAGPISNNGIELEESEPFTLYDNRPENVCGDIVWENIEFSGYRNQIVGFANVKRSQGYQAINYTGYTAREAQLKAVGQTADFQVSIEDRQGGSSRVDLTGVYSWGQKRDGSIDHARDNRAFVGNKQDMEQQPYVTMRKASVKDIFNATLNAADGNGANR